MKKLTTIITVFLLLLTSTVFSGCEQNSSADKINVVCTIYPQYDWVRQILGDQADNMALTLLLNNRIDLHNYQPSVDDIVKITSCDLFIYVGGESDSWVDNVLKNAANPNMLVINLMEELGDAAKIEEIKEGMEDEDPDQGEYEDQGEDRDDENGDFDEHVWLSLKNAKTLCPVITDALITLDAGSEETYQSNLAAYVDKLAALDSEYQTALAAAPVRTLLFGDRFPFRYLVDDYGLDYHAAFVGCSAETEASFDTIVFLAKKVDELNLQNIMVTESSDQAIAKTIRDNTRTRSQQILVLDAMQSVTANDVKNGTTYLSLMENNLNVLKEALK
ncbi:MAG: metal ABC transporter substrate-binding protein [Gracilibacteraceae bacterium]|jgi:zinc transport system substrate-binding protein|nr:metal ABC transporter substrate-binding protein [Gracilibacteraceae bacterium]